MPQLRMRLNLRHPATYLDLLPPLLWIMQIPSYRDPPPYPDPDLSVSIPSEINPAFDPTGV